MKRIIRLSVLVILIIPFIFSSCKTEEKEKINFEEGIPPTGTYFKILVDDVIWEGDYEDFAQMYVKTESQTRGTMYEFVSCTDYEDMISVVRKKVYINVVANNDNNFTNYRVMYIKNKSYNPLGKYYNFEEWMEYRSGSLNIIKNENGKITAKFKGKLKAANRYRDDADVIIYFQEFPVNPVFSN